jgi:ATP-dependent Lon protease
MNQIYPVLPLRNFVMFPGLLTTIQATDPYILSLLPETEELDGEFLVSLMVKHDEYFYQTTCLSRVEEVDLSQAPLIQLTLRGLSKFQVDTCPSTEPVIFGEGNILEDYYKSQDEARKDALRLGKLIKRYIFLDEARPDALLQAVSFISDPNILTNFCCHYFLDDPYEKQEFLQILNVNTRITKALNFLEIKVNKKIKSDQNILVY